MTRTTVLGRDLRLGDTIPCLIAPGPPNDRGYSLVRDRGQQRVGHRVALERKLGRPLLPGMEACHTCDVKMCVEPAHLWEGTHADNMRDAAQKGLLPSRKGERSGGAKLTAAQVEQIRCAPRRPYGYQRRLAARFGVHPRTISRVISQRTWPGAEAA